jgi:hypothetical protein
VAYETDASNGSQEQAFLRAFDLDGSPMGEPVPAVQADRASFRPVVAIDGTGRAAVAFAQPRGKDESQVVLRRFNYGDEDDSPPAQQPPASTPPATETPAPSSVAAGAGSVTPTPTPTPAAVRTCMSRRVFSIHLPIHIRKVIVRVDGHRVAVRSRARRVRIDLRGRPAGQVTVTIELRLRDGRRVLQTRRYRTCAAPAR